MSFTIRPATQRDAYELAPNLRAADLRECKGWGADPLESLAAAVASEGKTLTLSGDDNEVLGMFGHGGRHPVWDLTIIWMMGTDALIDTDRYRQEFHVQSKLAVEGWVRDHGNVGNMVHSENVVHIAWLIRLNFQINTRNVITSPSGEVYYPFIRRP